MRVNSTFIGVFVNRLVAKAGMAIVMPAIFFTASSFTNHSDPDLRAKQVNLMIRQIGHRLLLHAGDSTSRVMPVTETKDGTFLLQFENEFRFSHDSLLVLSQNLLPKTQFSSGYTVTVHDCANANIVYGFQLNNTSPDLLACRGRREPLGCYTIEFAFPDFYDNAEAKNADVAPVIEEHKSISVHRKTKSNAQHLNTTASNQAIDRLLEEPKSFTIHPEANPKPEEIKKTTSDFQTEPLAKESKSDIVDNEVTPELEDFKTTAFNHPITSLFYLSVVVLCITLIGRARKILTPVRVQDEIDTIVKGSVPELDALGKFIFDKKGQRLLLGSEVTTLTDKECKILELFNENFGELIPRETLMQKVWLDEGVITGRSLDMFVSKLRKKLSSDPELRITNIHGKGYRLEGVGA